MKNIVLIADIRENNTIDLSNNDLEFVEPSYLNNILGTLRLIDPHTKHYTSPQEFINNIKSHKNDIVLSIWSGRLSRNRKALIPAICEAYNISYVGADPYVNSICQDKALSKYVAKKFGIKSAKGILVKKNCTKDMISTLALPLIVKPNFEGGSNGISSNNVVFSYDEAITLCNRLLSYFHQPILIEEYMDGLEVCVTIAGTPDFIDVLEADAIIINTPNKYPVFGYEVKKEKSVECIRRPATSLLTADMKDSFKELFQGLGKVDIMRIDGKIKNNCFKMLELSPDTNLDKKASTAYAFNLAGYSYKEMFEKLISYVS